MKPMNWTNLYKNHKGKWVALREDETSVIVSGKTAKEVLEKSVKKGFTSPILARIPNNTLPFVG